MSEEKWTPEPWICGVWEGETKYSIMQGDSLETVAVTKTESNANLIAAAPEMLAALEWLNLHSFTAQNSPMVQSAIRKARGEE